MTRSSSPKVVAGWQATPFCPRVPLATTTFVPASRRSKKSSISSCRSRSRRGIRPVPIPLRPLPPSPGKFRQRPHPRRVATRAALPPPPDGRDPRSRVGSPRHRRSPPRRDLKAPMQSRVAPRPELEIPRRPNPRRATAVERQRRVRRANGLRRRGQVPSGAWPSPFSAARDPRGRLEKIVASWARREMARVVKRCWNGPQDRPASEFVGGFPPRSANALDYRPSWRTGSGQRRVVGVLPGPF